MTHEDAWEVAQEAAEYGHTVELTAHDDKKFYGLLTHIDYHYLILDGRGFPLDDILDLEVIYST